MRRIATLFLAVLTACGSPKPADPTAPSNAPTDSGPAPTPTTVQPADTQSQGAAPPAKVTTVEGITEYKLDNGLRVLLLPDPASTNVTVNVTYMVGSRSEGYGETGMAHLLEHMLFKGTPKHAKIWELLQQRGAEFNGTTDYDRTNYFETLAATGDNLEWALSLEADRMVNSNIADSDLQSEFSVVRNEFETGENRVAGILTERMLSTAFLWHNYGKSPIGSRSDIERVPATNLKTFYEKYYQPDNAMLIVAGKIDAEKTLATINDTFGAIPKPTRTLPTSYTVEPVQDGQREVVLARNGDTQIVGVLYHVMAGPDEDYVSVEALAHVLGTEPAGRLYQALVAPGLASSVWTTTQALAEPTTLMAFAEVPLDKSLPAVRDLLLKTVEELGTPEKAPTAEEITRFQTEAAKNFDLVVKDTRRLAELLTEFQAQGDWRLIFLRRDRIAKLDPAAVAKVAAAYLLPSNRTIGTFVPTKDAARAPMPAKPDVVALTKDYTSEAVVDAGEAFDATIANIESRTTRKDIGGVKTALLPKKTRGGTVSARLTLRYGTPETLAGTDELGEVVMMMMKRGTTKHTFQQIEDELAKLKSEVDFDSGPFLPSPGVINVTIKSNRDSFPATFALVTEMLKESTFPADQFAIVHKERRTKLEALQTDPQILSILAGIRKVRDYPPEDVRHVPTIQESIAALDKVTVADVQAFHKGFFGASDAQLAVVGDFDAAAFEAFVTESYGGWKSPKPFARIVMESKPNAAGEELIDTPDKEGAFVVEVHAMKLKEEDADYAALKLANYVFGGAPASRLMGRLRQKEGWSYGTFSDVQGGDLDDFGLFISLALTAPQNAKKAENGIVEELTKLVSEGIPDDELKTAKEGWKNGFDTQLADDSWVAQKLADGLYLGRTLQFEQTLNDKVQTLTAADIKAVLAKGWLDPKKLSLVIAGDQKKANAPQ